MVFLIIVVNVWIYYVLNKKKMLNINLGSDYDKIHIFVYNNN